VTDSKQRIGLENRNYEIEKEGRVISQHKASPAATDNPAQIPKQLQNGNP